MSNNKTTQSGQGPATHMITHESGPGMSLPHMALFVLLITNLILIPLSLFAIGDESGPIASLKYLTVGFAASAAAYGVSRFALDSLAPLHAIGFRLAGTLAIVGILLTGAGTSLGSFTAIVFGSVETKEYQLTGKELAGFIGSVNEAALVTERIGPTVQAIAEDIERTARCEVKSSCLSRRGNGGRGPMSNALDAEAGRAFGIVEALVAGALERKHLLDGLNRLNEQYHAELADTDKSMSERRAGLQAIHSKTRQASSTLSEALPISLIRGFANDLRSGAQVSGNPSGSRILSAFLRDHGDALSDQLDRLPEVNLTVPEFRDRPGMLDVLRYLADFAAIAAIVFVGELCLPITLYVMTWLRLYWEIEKLKGPREHEPEDNGLGGLIDPPKGS